MTWTLAVSPQHSPHNVGFNKELWGEQMKSQVLSKHIPSGLRTALFQGDEDSYGWGGDGCDWAVSHPLTCLLYTWKMFPPSPSIAT